MDTNMEMLKAALLGGSAASSQMFINKLSRECSSEIMMHPERDPSSVVAEKARTSGMNKKQTDRLTEETNKKLIQPVLKSNRKAQKVNNASKKKVRSILEGENKRPESDYSMKDGKVHKRPGASPSSSKSSSMDKTASLSGMVHGSTNEAGDYFDEPMTLQSHTLIDSPYMNKNAHDPHVPSQREIAKSEEYRDYALQNTEDKLSGLQQEHMSMSLDWCKTAEQSINQGAKWQDIVDMTIQAGNDKESCELLKSAAGYLGVRFLIEEPAEWIEAIDSFKDGLGSMDKISRIALPVEESLISKDISGRVRVINGDHQLVKKLRKIKCNEVDQRKSSIAIKRLHSFGQNHGIDIVKSVA